MAYQERTQKEQDFEFARKGSEIHSVLQKLIDKQWSILKTVKVYEAIYQVLPEHRSERYKKEDFMEDGVDNNILNDCYLCEYSNNRLSIDNKSLFAEPMAMCECCPCTEYLGDRCYRINDLVSQSGISARTARWALKNIYIIARESNTPCEFTYWNKVKYTGGK
jgi:hypothetical protein